MLPRKKTWGFLLGFSVHFFLKAARPSKTPLGVITYPGRIMIVDREFR